MRRSCNFLFPGNAALCNRLLLPFHKADAQERMTQHVGNRMRTKMLKPTLVFAACMFSWYTGCFVRSSNILNKFIPWHDFRFA